MLGLTFLKNSSQHLLLSFLLSSKPLATKLSNSFTYCRMDEILRVMAGGRQKRGGMRRGKGGGGSSLKVDFLEEHQVFQKKKLESC